MDFICNDSSYVSSVGVATIVDEGPTTIQAAVGSVSNSTILTGTPYGFDLLALLTPLGTVTRQLCSRTAKS